MVNEHETMSGRAVEAAGDVDVLFIVSDATIRGVTTAARVAALLGELKTKVGRHYLIVNRAAQGLSPELEALFGLPPGSFDSRYESWLKLVHPEDLPRVEPLMADAFARREPRHETDDEPGENVHRVSVLTWLKAPEIRRSWFQLCISSAVRDVAPGK